MSGIAGSFGARRVPPGARSVAGSPLALANARVEDAPVACVIDGRIDDASELAKRAGLDPSAPPERLVAEGFRRLGEECFAHLRGAFAAVVWDAERRRGAIARDRIGEAPLHLFEEPGGGLLFAPDPGDLVRMLPVPPPPDEAWLAHWLARRIAGPELTPFAGLRRVPAGHLIRLDGERWSVESWWRPRPPERLDLEAPAAAAELRAAMAAAVERVLARSESPAVMLSGGFDSASVAALASRARSLPAYSGVFPDHPAADESERIATVRSALGLTGVEQNVAGGSALAATLDFVREWHVPPASPNVFLWRPLLERAAADGVDVLLDGEGGDEVFGCSPPLLADLLRRGRLIALREQTRRVPGMGDEPERRKIKRALWRYAVLPTLPPTLHDAARRARGREQRPAPWLAERLRAMLDDARRDEWKRRRGPRWWAALVDATGPRSDALGAADQFRREARDAGLRLAHPWRDAELIDFVLRLPPALAFDPHLDRALAREAMRGLVPDRVRLDDTKPYFNDPLADALTGPDRLVLGELVTAPELAPYVRPERLAELLDPRRGPGWSLDAWRVAAAAAWLRAHSDPDGFRRLLERSGATETRTRQLDKSTPIIGATTRN